MPGFVRLKEAYDIVVVGGGHAGLQAGLKAGLLHHSAAILDRGPKYGRSFYAPRMDNIPGFPEGVSGHKLLDAQIAAVRRVPDWVDYVTPARVLGAHRSGEGGYSVDFSFLGQERVVRSRALVLAMGVVDRMPEVAGKIEPIFPWANFAIVDFCILCDGHDLPGHSVAVLGHDAFAAETALDLQHFAPSSIVILTNGEPFLDGLAEERRRALEERLAGAKITHRTDAIAGFDGIREKRFEVVFQDGGRATFDRGFSGLGWYDMHGAIPRSLGASFDDEGYVRVDDASRVLDAGGQPVPGLYCVGDLKSGWNQIPEAWASAERAVIHAYAEYL
ncbi:MAG TPA: NAD(P)/FAD-dependent oxidoreductase [Thermoplasmata archaeon]|nr:NAD(P)/FAD-dependent oxidoreductase [Thermoplasmata archaeon]